MNKFWICHRCHCISSLYQDSFCHCKVRTKLNFQSSIQIFQFKFFSKTHSPSVFFKDGLMIYVFESPKWKAKIQIENPDWKCLKCGLPWGKLWPLCTLWRNLHMFLTILDFRAENKRNCLEKTVLKMWSQICDLTPYVSSKHESVYNLWRILRTKLVVLVDFWDHIFITVLPKPFF